MPVRVREIDAVRGLAIAGVTLVNAWQATAGPWSAADWSMALLAQGRFYPILAFLFGLGFTLTLRTRPRELLFRRLTILAVLGLLHHAFYPADVLLPYAVTGLLVLLPASFLPERLLLPLAVTATAWAAFFGGLALIPGLFLLGMATARKPFHPSKSILALCSAASAALTLAWIHWPTTALFVTAALTGAAAYVTAFLLALRTCLRRPLLATFEPLGRLALTNYVAGTAIVMFTHPLLTSDRTALLLGTTTLALQIAYSRRTLNRPGPLESLWRQSADGQGSDLRHMRFGDHPIRVRTSTVSKT